jgi:hypothetical protein
MTNKLNLSPMAAAVSRIAAQVPDIFSPRHRSGDKRVLLEQYQALEQQIRRYVPASAERLPLIVVYDQFAAPRKGRGAQPKRGLAVPVYPNELTLPVLQELDMGSSYLEDVLAGFGIDQALVCGMTVLEGTPVCFLGLFHHHHIDHLVVLRAGAPVFLPVQSDIACSTLPALHKIVRLADPDRLQLLEVFAPPNKVAAELSPALVQWLHSVQGKTAPFFRGPSLKPGHRAEAILN